MLTVLTMTLAISQPYTLPTADTCKACQPVAAFTSAVQATVASVACNQQQQQRRQPVRNAIRAVFGGKCR
jgi:hypothetical protein